jgi:hypothetical protein
LQLLPPSDCLYVQRQGTGLLILDCMKSRVVRWPYRCLRRMMKGEPVLDPGSGQCRMLAAEYQAVLGQLSAASATGLERTTGEQAIFNLCLPACCVNSNAYRFCVL